MNTITLQTITARERAALRKKAELAIRPAQVRLEDLLDPDYENWESVRETCRDAQQEMFKEKYPTLYAKYFNRTK